MLPLGQLGDQQREWLSDEIRRGVAKHLLGRGVDRLDQGSLLLGVETHGVIDIDAQGHAAQAIALLNNLVLGLLRVRGFSAIVSARRRFSARPLEALALVLNAFI